MTSALSDSQPKAVEKTFPKPGGLPSVPAAAARKSGGRLPLAIVGIVLLLAAAIGAYALLRQSGNAPTNAETSPSPSPGVLAEASPVFSAGQQVETEAANKAPTVAKGEKQKTEIRQIADKQQAIPASKSEATPAVSAGTALTESKEVAPREEPKSDTANMVKTTPLPKVEQPKASSTELLQRGLNAQNSGRHQEALSEFQKALQLDPSNVSIYYLIGSSYHKLGQLDQALAAYRRCTAGPYARVSAEHVKTLEKKVGKSKY
jgi:tetratricopeptide (TPR) repeat protein